MDKSKPVSRMAAIMDFFELEMPEEKKEYMKLTEKDRIELGELLKQQGYNITPQ